MEYVSVGKIAEKWGVTTITVYNAAKTGRIPGAEFIDGKWHIPEDAVQPTK
jgi:predicted site-specific integrase-resolvase